MGSLNPSPEITLDFRPTFIPKTIGQFLGEVSRISNVTEKLLQVDDFVKRLETETRKIEAFKDLPLCMLLMNDGSFISRFLFLLLQFDQSQLVHLLNELYNSIWKWVLVSSYLFYAFFFSNLCVEGGINDVKENTKF